MKLTNEQIATIKQLVNNEVNYNETYLEVYDHVITALEHRDTITDIQNAYAEILEQDLGGHSGLAKLEAESQKAISAQMFKAKWHTFGMFFKWPLLPFTILLGIGIYYFAGIKEVRITTAIIVLVAAFLPLLFLPVSNFMIGLKGRLIKRSVKDGVLNAMMSGMFKLYMRIIMLGFFLNVIPLKFKLIDDISLSFPFTIMACSVFCTLHTMAIFKVYGREYKTLIRP